MTSLPDQQARACDRIVNRRAGLRLKLVPPLKKQGAEAPRRIADHFVIVTFFATPNVV